MRHFKLNSKFGTLTNISTVERFVWSRFVKRCSELLQKNELNSEDLADALISLHVVLECSMNDFFRELFQRHPIGEEELSNYEQLDKINFIDKCRMFILTTDFDFSESVNDLPRHNKLINRMVAFSEVRNRLLHGHVVISFEDSNGNSGSSKTKKLISQEVLNRQVDLFKYIVDGMRFYISHLKKDQYTKNFLITYFDYSYFPERFKKRASLS